MKTYIVDGVLPAAVKVTRDNELFGVAPTDPEFGEYASLEVRVNVEALRQLRVESDGGDDNATEITRTKNTRISLEPNPRAQKFTTDVAKAIEASLLDRDGHFHRKNRGALITAHSFNFDNKTQQLTWTETEPEAHGCVDGGHTLAIIDTVVGGPKWVKADQTLRAEGKEPKPQFVTLQIVKGLPIDEIPLVAGARNSSVNVEDFALQELEGKFEFLKPVLQDKGLIELIAFKQNEKTATKANTKVLDIVGVLQRLTTLDNLEFSDDQNQPYHAYWSRSKTTDDFAKLSENYHRLAELTPDALALPEYIIGKYSEWYGKTSGKNNTGRPKFGRTRECKDANKETRFYFLPIVKPELGMKTVKYQMQTEALSMPILAALRTIVSTDKKARWLENPYSFLDAVGPTLVDSLNSAISFHHNATSVLKNKDVWKNLYLQAKIAAIELGLVRLQRSK